MGQVSASSTVEIAAAPETVLAAVADYVTVRPKILSPHYFAPPTAPLTSRRYGKAGTVPVVFFHLKVCWASMR